MGSIDETMALIKNALASNQRLIESKRMKQTLRTGGTAVPTEEPLGEPAPVMGGLTEAAFNSALQKLLQASGGKVKVSSGKRSTARQKQLWEAAVKKYGSPEKARKWVAPPGKSRHESGLAADLSFADDSTKAWVHANAKKFGLYFPMGHEPWHIELVGSRA